MAADRDFWDAKARLDHGLHAVMTRRWTRAQCAAVHQQMQAVIVRAVRESRADATIWLDLGCGTGRLLDLPFTFDLAVTGALGVDPSSEMCRRASRAHERDPRVQVMQATGSALPIADQMVNCALSVAVLQHLDLATLRQTCTEVNRVLAPGGTLVMLEGTREAHGGVGLEGTTATELFSIDQFRDSLGARISLISTAHMTFIDDRYTRMVWRKQL